VQEVYWKGEMADAHPFFPWIHLLHFLFDLILTYIAVSLRMPADFLPNSTKGIEHARLSLGAWGCNDDPLVLAPTTAESIDYQRDDGNKLS
jgi:hypothetical protein